MAKSVRASFQTVAKQFQKSPLLGTALMDLGWCHSFSDKLVESGLAFQAIMLLLGCLYIQRQEF